MERRRFQSFVIAWGVVDMKFSGAFNEIPNSTWYIVRQIYVGLIVIELKFHLLKIRGHELELLGLLYRSSFLDPSDSSVDRREST